jgi:hypothetical protein
MARRSLPTSDSRLLQWSLNFKTLIGATPAAFGLTPALAASYAALHDAYTTALAASDPTNRSRSTTATKNEARTTLRTNARLLMNMIAGTAGVTESQKVELGFALRGAASAIPAPTAPPSLQILLVTAWTVKLKLRDSQSSANRGKPPGVSGASLFVWFGGNAEQDPPTDLSDWKFQGNTGRTLIDINFPSTLPPGSKVWIAAFWFNGRKQGGPLTTPVGVHLQGGSVSVAA